jgi:hypothetical protein
MQTDRQAVNIPDTVDSIPNWVHQTCHRDFAGWLCATFDASTWLLIACGLSGALHACPAKVCGVVLKVGNAHQSVPNLLSAIIAPCRPVGPLAADLLSYHSKVGNSAASHQRCLLHWYAGRIWASQTASTACQQCLLLFAGRVAGCECHGGGRLSVYLLLSWRGTVAIMRLARRNPRGNTGCAVCTTNHARNAVAETHF